MDRALFERRFLHATTRARDFARRFVEEKLPDAMRFRVHLNSSCDLHAASEFRLFPEDSSASRAFATKWLDADGAIEELFRDGLVPQWIDVQVVSENGDVTVLDLLACGRFTDDEERLYYTWTDVAPFGVKGPPLPVKYVEGVPFSVHQRSSCWSVDELRCARRHAERVWSLDLHGPELDDEVVAGGIRFADLEILDTSWLAWTDRAVATLAGVPRLRVYRAQLGGATSVRADGALAAPRLEALTLALPTIPDWVRIPKSLTYLSVHAPETTDADVERLLASCPAHLDSVGLRGTPV